MTIPSTATVVSITVDGDGQISSECPNLPPVTGYKCWVFTWEDDESGSLQDAVFTSLTIGDNVYNVPSGYNPYDNDNSLISPYETLLGEWIDTNPQFEGLVLLGCDDGTNSFSLKIQVPEGLSAPQLKITNPSGDGTHTLYLIAEEDEDCENC